MSACGKFLLAAAGAALAFTASANANVLVGGFNGSVDAGWTATPNQNPQDSISTQTLKGVTEGTGALATTWNANTGTFWGPRIDFIANGSLSSLLSSSGFRYDVTWVGADLNGGSGSFGGFAQSNALAFNDNLGHFIQVSSTTGTATDSSGFGFGFGGSDHTATLTYPDWSKFTITSGLDPGFTGSEPYLTYVQNHTGGVGSIDNTVTSVALWIVMQVGNGTPVGPPIVYLDNAQLVIPVPEPATLALLGLGLPVLAIRRRRA